MKILSATLLLLICFRLPAQVEVSSGAELVNDATIQGAYWNRALGHDETGYYLLRRFGSISNEKIVVEKYSPAMKLLWSGNIPGATGAMGDSKLFRKIEFNNGKILTFWEGWNKALGQNSLVMHELGDDGTLSDDEFLLETEPSPGQMRSATYQVSFSPDGSKMLVITEKPFEKGSKEMMRLQVFSTENYQSIWKQNLTLDNESARNPRNDISVDNAGNAHVFKDVKVNNKEHYYQLVTASASTSTVELIDLKTYFPINSKMLIDPSGNLIIAGTLAAPGLNWNWQGVWYLKADASGKIITNVTEPLGANLLRQILPEKQAVQEDAKLNDYVLKDVLLKPDGGILLLGEYQHDIKTIVGQSTPPVYNHDLSFGGVVLLSFAPDGTRTWNTFYAKKQNEYSPEENMHYGSFAYQLKNDKLYMVWNYMEVQSDALTRYRYWIDRSGAKINIDNLFGKEALYPTLLTVVNADGSLDYTDRTFNALPLEEIQKPNAYPMAIDPSFFFATKDGIIVLSRMPGAQAKRYKFNTIRF